MLDSRQEIPILIPSPMHFDTARESYRRESRQAEIKTISRFPRNSFPVKRRKYDRCFVRAKSVANVTLTADKLLPVYM